MNVLHQNKEIATPWWTEMILQPSCWDVLLLRYLEQILKLVDAETQLSHAGLEQFPQTVLLHQTHKHTKGLLFWHLQEQQTMCRLWKKSVLFMSLTKHCQSELLSHTSRAFFQQIAFNPRQKFGFLGSLPALAADQQ